MEYIGQKYDEHEQPVSDDWKLRRKSDIVCRIPSTSGLPSSSSTTAVVVDQIAIDKSTAAAVVGGR
jgi:hypothetical protein